MADQPAAATSAPAQQQQQPHVTHTPTNDVASDPEEDDLSDLDDVLDDFAATKLDANPTAPAQAAAAPLPPKPAVPAPSVSDPAAATDHDHVSPAELLLEDEDAIAQQLQKMEQQLGKGYFQKQFDDIMQEMSKEMGADPVAGASTQPNKGSAPADASGSKGDKNFQDTIRKTMERMQESGDAASSAAAASADQDDLLAQMLKEMESSGFGGEGSEEDFSKILMGMMEQLTNKEILYEPMKELDDKFPKWMQENRGKVSKEDLARYEEQQALVREITERFERKGYSDENAQDRAYIVERMQKMQAAGTPPPDLVGDMNAAQEALAGMDEGCPTQ